MALTLAVFAAALVAMPLWISPHLITPAQYTRPVVANLTAMQMTSSGQLNDPVSPCPAPGSSPTRSSPHEGKVFSLPQVAACQTGTQAQCDAYLAKQSLRQQVVYQPASRYWTFQILETAIWLAIAATLAGFCTWRIRRPDLTHGARGHCAARPTEWPRLAGRCHARRRRRRPAPGPAGRAWRGCGRWALDGGFAEVEPGGDLGVRPALGHAAGRRRARVRSSPGRQATGLPGRAAAVVLDQPPGNRRGEEGLAVGHRAHGPGQLLAAGVLEQEAARAGLQRVIRRTRPG